MSRKCTPLQDRIIANSVLVYNPETGDSCWTWIGKRKKGGYYYYGHINIQENKISKSKLAHRISYESFKETQIPEGYHIDHLCHNTLCVNPEHLEAVPGDVNLARRRYYARS